MKLSKLVQLAITAFVFTGCASHKEPQSVYISFQLNSDKQVQLTKDVLHKMDSKLSSADEVIIDLMHGNTTANIYSDSARSHRFKEATEHALESVSTDGAIVASINRAVQLGRNKKVFTAVIVTEGTCSSSELSEIEEIVSSMNTTTHIVVMGLAIDNRLCMSKAFSAVQDRIKFASSEEEWLLAIDKL